MIVKLVSKNPPTLQFNKRLIQPDQDLILHTYFYLLKSPQLNLENEDLLELKPRQIWGRVYSSVDLTSNYSAGKLFYTIKKDEKIGIQREETIQGVKELERYPIPPRETINLFSRKPMEEFKKEKIKVSLLNDFYPFEYFKIQGNRKINSIFEPDQEPIDFYFDYLMDLKVPSYLRVNETSNITLVKEIGDIHKYVPREISNLMNTGVFGCHITVVPIEGSYFDEKSSGDYNATIKSLINMPIYEAQLNYTIIIRREIWAVVLPFIFVIGASLEYLRRDLKNSGSNSEKFSNIINISDLYYVLSGIIALSIASYGLLEVPFTEFLSLKSGPVIIIALVLIGNILRRLLHKNITSVFKKLGHLFGKKLKRMMERISVFIASLKISRMTIYLVVFSLLLSGSVIYLKFLATQTTVAEDLGEYLGREHSIKVNLTSETPQRFLITDMPGVEIRARPIVEEFPKATYERIFWGFEISLFNNGSKAGNCFVGLVKTKEDSLPSDPDPRIYKDLHISGWGFMEKNTCLDVLRADGEFNRIIKYKESKPPTDILSFRYMVDNPHKINFQWGGILAFN